MRKQSNPIDRDLSNEIVDIIFTSIKKDKEVRDELITDRDFQEYVKYRLEDDTGKVYRILIKYALYQIDKEAYLRALHFETLGQINREVVKLYNQYSKLDAGDPPQFKVDEIYDRLFKGLKVPEASTEDSLDLQLAKLIWTKWLKPEPDIVQQFDTKTELKNWLLHHINDDDSQMRLYRWSRRRVSVEDLVSKIKREIARQ